MRASQPSAASTPDAASVSSSAVTPSTSSPSSSRTRSCSPRARVLRPSRAAQPAAQLRHLGARQMRAERGVRRIEHVVAFIEHVSQAASGGTSSASESLGRPVRHAP